MQSSKFRKRRVQSRGGGAMLRKKRVQRFLRSRLKNKRKGYDFSDAPDARQQGKIEHKKESLIWALEIGLLSNQRTLRDVEELLKELGPWAQGLVPDAISDTTLDAAARCLDSAYLLEKLVLQSRDFHRSKMLEPVGVPIGVVTVDGKNLATLDHDAGGTGHKRSSSNAKWHRSKQAEAEQGSNYYLMPALRATLTSSEAKQCIFQKPLPPKTGESTAFPEFVDELQKAYGRSDMYEVVDADAGLTSLKNANSVNGYGLGYVFGLKENQPTMYVEAERLLLASSDAVPAEGETPWEKRGSRMIRRSLWRSREMQGIETSAGTWDHLRQVWLVRQESKLSDGTVEQEDRYFITSLTWKYLKPHQILQLVRNHWGVENDTFNSLDMQWREDSGPWCTKGDAVWGLGLLRLMAYNLAQILRRRRLRKKRSDGTSRPPMSWRLLFKMIEKAFEMESETVCTG